MTQGQKTCRTVAWAFSIVEVVLFTVLCIVAFVEYAAVKNITSDMSNYVNIDAIYLPMGIVMIILAGVQVMFMILNGKARKDDYSHIALGVLQLIFGGLISGILMLCSGGNTKNHE